MDPFEQKMAAARQSYRAIRYRAAALDPARLERRSVGFFPRPGRRPALAIGVLLAVLLALALRNPAPDPAPRDLAGMTIPSISSPMDTLSAARRAITMTPAAPPRPAQGIFRLPAPPRRLSHFAAASG